MVPATAGLACALLIFGLVTAILAIPGPLQANNQQDVPLMLNTGPELQQSVFGTTLSAMNTDSLVIEAYVDKNGRVQDYKILSDPGVSGTSAAGKADADLHDVPSRDVDGASDPVAGGAVVLES